MSNQPQQTPLVDMLRSVPRKHRTEWETQWAEDGTATGHAMSPIGKHCHDAADRIEQLEAQLAESNHALDCITTTSGELQDVCNGLEAQLDRVRELPDEWLIQITDTDDEKLGIRFCAHELQQALEQDNDA